MAHLSLMGLCKGNQLGGSFIMDFRDGTRGLVYCGPSKICKERLWNWEPLATRALLGNQKGAHLPGNL